MMKKEILVIISLKGGVDALNFLIPYREPDYYSLRPTLAILPPGNAGPCAIDLDGFFGIHPALAPLLPLYQNSSLAFLHAVGWPGDTHSHFQAWQEIEAGAVGNSLPNSGWMARYLQ